MQTRTLLASLPRSESARERPGEVIMAGHLLACKKLEFPTASGRMEPCRFIGPDHACRR